LKGFAIMTVATIQKDIDISALAPNTLLTFKEAMGYLRVSRSTLYRLMWAGEITGRKVGKTWRFYPTDLQPCIHEVSAPVTSPIDSVPHHAGQANTLVAMGR
jgi:excisionase family DNA binding protein